MTTQRLKHDLQRLTRPDPAAGEMPPARVPKAIQGGKGLGPGPGGTTAGIASPLTEANYSARAWHPTMIYSSDGLLAWPQIKTLVLTDANNAEVVIELAAKP